MSPDSKLFSDAAREDLRKLLRRQPRPAATIEAIIEALELGAANWRSLTRLDREGNEQDRRVRAWLLRLGKHLAHARDALSEMPEGALVHQARSHRLLSLGIKATEAEAKSLLAGRGGRDSRDVLNRNLARALHMHGVPLKKTRSGLAHRIFEVVYAELQLSRQGDVFHALVQGINRLGQPNRVNVSPAAQQVLQPRRKRQ